MTGDTRTHTWIARYRARSKQRPAAGVGRPPTVSTGRAFVASRIVEPATEKLEGREPSLGNCVFSSKRCMLSPKIRYKYHLVSGSALSRWVRFLKLCFAFLNHPSLSKRSTGYIRQDLGRQHSILLSVTHMLCVGQVCHAVSRCVKDGSFSLSSLE